jgi:hypothetical protein
MGEVDPVFRLAESLHLVVRIAKCGADRVDAVEFHDPVLDLLRKLLSMPLLKPKKAITQTMGVIVDLADDLKIKLQCVPIGEQDRIAPIVRFSTL